MYEHFVFFLSFLICNDGLYFKKCYENKAILLQVICEFYFGKISLDISVVGSARMKMVSHFLLENKPIALPTAAASFSLKILSYCTRFCQFLLSNLN